jgi:hypothetical protein
VSFINDIFQFHKISRDFAVTFFIGFFINGVQGVYFIWIFAYIKWTYFLFFYNCPATYLVRLVRLKLCTQNFFDILNPFIEKHFKWLYAKWTLLKKSKKLPGKTTIKRGRHWSEIIFIIKIKSWPLQWYQTRANRSTYTTCSKLGTFFFLKNRLHYFY